MILSLTLEWLFLLPCLSLMLAVASCTHPLVLDMYLGRTCQL